jgi:hypothetical protein
MSMLVSIVNMLVNTYSVVMLIMYMRNAPGFAHLSINMSWAGWRGC